MDYVIYKGRHCLALHLESEGEGEEADQNDNDDNDAEVRLDSLERSFFQLLCVSMLSIASRRLTCCFGLG